MADVLLIGKGPAAISASLYILRAGLSSLHIARDGGALLKAEKIENYYGLSHPMSGEELLETGVKQAKALGAEFVEEQVVSIAYNDGFDVVTPSETYHGKALILATGSSRVTPKIPGLTDYEGKGVSYCAVCDAFFHRGKDVAVLGSGEYALHEASELLPVCKTVTLLTNGEPAPKALPNGLLCNTIPIKELQGSDLLQQVVFDGGEALTVTGFFVAVGVAGTADLAKKLGIATENNKVVVNEKMQTNLPGVFAAGDCTGGLLQVAKAVADGAVAGTSAIQYVRGLKK